MCIKIVLIIFFVVISIIFNRSVISQESTMIYLINTQVLGI